MSKVYIVLSLDHAADKVTTPEGVWTTVEKAQDHKVAIENRKKLAFVVERELDREQDV